MEIKKQVAIAKLISQVKQRKPELEKQAINFIEEWTKAIKEVPPFNLDEIAQSVRFVWTNQWGMGSPSKTNYQKYLTGKEISVFISTLQANAKEEKRPLKFKLDWFSNRLWWNGEEYHSEIPEKSWFLSQYSEQRFFLDPSQPDHWIDFTDCGEEVQVFYKRVEKANSIIYYQKNVPKKVVIEFKLTKKDIIARRDDKKIKFG